MVWKPKTNPTCGGEKGQYMKRKFWVKHPVLAVVVGLMAVVAMVFTFGVAPPAGDNHLALNTGQQSINMATTTTTDIVLDTSPPDLAVNDNSATINNTTIIDTSSQTTTANNTSTTLSDQANQANTSQQAMAVVNANSARNGPTANNQDNNSLILSNPAMAPTLVNERMGGFGAELATANILTTSV